MIYERKKIKDEDIVIEKKNYHERSPFDDINQLEYYLVDQIKQNVRLLDPQSTF